MFEILLQEMKLRNFSLKTIKAYLFYNQKFIEFIKKSPKEISGNDIRNYLLYLESKKKSTSMINLAHNALNFYYGIILRKNVNKIPFQKREDTIKQILSKEEIKRLIDVTENPKHKLVISLLYASGIRVSELIKIRLEHLDLERKMLLVKQGKGKKDRYTILSENVIKMIKDYLNQRYYQNKYLFNSYQEHLSVRTIQEILKQARQKARINKNVHPHLLRHSFATHLMENDVPETKIQLLLGHKDIKTTQQYARVTNKHLLGIQSPHDNL